MIALDERDDKVQYYLAKKGEEKLKIENEQNLPFMQ
jgi:hypothetical protein